MTTRNTKPLVSVVIHAYNTGEYLQECVQGVLNQTYPNLEIILINDGSTDQTRQIIDTLSQEYSNIIPIHNPSNLGLIASLNKGIQASTGDYIARTDSDDVNPPDWIESILQHMLTHPDVLACGGFLTVRRMKHDKGLSGTIFQDGIVWQKTNQSR